MGAMFAAIAIKLGLTARIVHESPALIQSFDLFRQAAFRKPRCNRSMIGVRIAEAGVAEHRFVAKRVQKTQQISPFGRRQRESGDKF